MYCFIQEVPAPIEMYDRLHAEVNARVGDRDLGLLVHLARDSSTGFTIIEIWRSKTECDAAIAEILVPAMHELFGTEGPATVPPMTEFDPRGLIIPAAGVFV